MLRSIDFKTMPYLFTDKAGTCLTVEFDGRELDDIYKQVKTMYDQAHPSHPSDDMPTEPGWYATRDGEDLLSYDGDAWHIHNMGVFEKLLNEGWQILRVDTMPTTELRDNAVTATNVYILEREANDD